MLIVNLAARYRLELGDEFKLLVEDGILNKNRPLLERLQLVIDFTTLGWEG